MSALLIELSEKGRVVQVSRPRSDKQSIILEKHDFEDKYKHGNGRPLGGIKLKPEDAKKVFIKALLSSGVTASEIVAELFAQLHDVDPEIVEFCMRR